MAKDLATRERERDLQSTAEIERGVSNNSLGTMVEPTAVSDARKVEVGDVFRPVMPTLMGESRPEITRAAPITPPRPQPVPLRSTSLPSKPPPPIPSSDSIPEVYSDVISVGESTVADTQSDVNPPLRRDSEDNTNEDTRPEPARATRRKPASGPVKMVRRKGALDADDFVATVDQAQFTLLGRLSGSKTLIVIAAIASALMFTLLLIVLWPAKHPQVLPEPVYEEPELPTLMKVHLKFGRGVSQVTIDGQAVTDNAVIDHLRGSAQVRFNCPGKKRGSKPVPSGLTATIPPTASIVELPVNCE